MAGATTVATVPASLPDVPRSAPALSGTNLSSLRGGFSRADGMTSSRMRVIRGPCKGYTCGCRHLRVGSASPLSPSAMGNVPYVRSNVGGTSFMRGVFVTTSTLFTVSSHLIYPTATTVGDC